MTPFVSWQEFAGSRPCCPPRAIVGDLIIADFADPNVENIVVALRVVRVENDVDVAAAGVISIPGVGVWPVACEIE